MIHKLYVTTARGLVPQLHSELEALGAGSVRVDGPGCRVRGPLEFAYKICLWSHCAQHVLLPLRELVADSADELYDQIRTLTWEDHVKPDGTLAVDFTGKGKGINHTGFGAQRVKDGIVDRFRDRYRVRPSVDRNVPDLQVNVHARGRSYIVSIDLSGSSLHRRGYRHRAGPAPLRETTAAGLVVFSGWNPLEDALVDPMCGAGTILIEAAMMAADVAPGRTRTFGFERWLGHDSDAWRALLAEAQERAAARPVAEPPRLFGYDANPSVLEVAAENATRAGVGDWIVWSARALSALGKPPATPGFVVCNPPYGERLGEKADARDLLSLLGGCMRGPFADWRLAVIAPDDSSLSAVGLPASRTQSVDNGPIEARFAAFEPGDVPEAGELAVANRLRKNLKRLRRWIHKEDIHCFRLYDADIPEFNAAVDVYEDQVHVQEYEAPRTIDPDVAAARLTTVTAAVATVLSVPPSQIHVKVRRQQRGSAQYERYGKGGPFFEVREGGLRFLVNLTDYLDTGLFLDHRQTRRMVAEWARGKRCLNLFCYTGSFSVYAAAAGAASSVSVDLSNTYLDWARRNFDLNELDTGRHRLVRADCLRWLEQTSDTFDLAIVDPPTFSNSKAMEETFDVLRDHERLLAAVMRRIAPGGRAVFSTNARRFKLSPTLEQRFAVEDITDQTVPLDFQRGRPPHRCWVLTHRSAE